MLNQLREAWVQVPDWRLGQLIVNAASPEGLIDIHSLFSVEDGELERLLVSLSSGVANRTTYYPKADCPKAE
jgi:hypothetical protein